MRERVNPFPFCIQILMYQHQTTFKNIVEKGEIAYIMSNSSYATMFSNFSIIVHLFTVILDLFTVILDLF